MLFLHEIHEVVAGKTEVFESAFREQWLPLAQEGGAARLVWFWHLTHGTGASYQAVSLTAVRDWAAWADVAARWRSDPRHRDWRKRVGEVRRDVVQKLLVPTEWSPLQDVDLAAPDVAAPPTPGMYLHDTGWPFPGMLDDYAAALGRVFHAQVQQTRMISIAGCFTVAPGTGRHHEVVLLQKIEDWDRFAQLLTRGEQGAQRGGWMVEGLRYRDKWESKLLRCAGWSPRH